MPDAIGVALDMADYALQVFLHEFAFSSTLHHAANPAGREGPSTGT